MTEKEITIELKNPEIWVLIFILLSILVFELLVTFNNPISFGDEAFHTRMAQWIGENVEYPTWIPFTQTKNFKADFSRPPYWELLLTSFLYLFGFKEAFVRFLPPFVAFLTGLAVFLLGKELYNKKVGFMASIMAVTIPSFITYSVLIYTDVLVTFFLTMFFLLFVLSIKKGEKKYLVLSGIFGGFSFLSKITGFAAYIFIFLVCIYVLIKQRKLYGPFKKYFVLFLVLTSMAFIILIIHISRNYFYYGTPGCYWTLIPYSEKFINFSGCTFNVTEFESKYNYTGRTEQVGTEQNVYNMGITNYLNFAFGNIFFVVFAAISGVFLLLYKKDNISIFILFMLLIFLVLFATQASTRAEDTARYTLALTPFICLTAAKWFEEVYNFIGRYQKYLALVVFIFIIIFSYLNLKDKLDTMAKVKQFSPTFFEACDWVKKNLPRDAVLSTVWSSRAAYSCQRDVRGNEPDVFLSRDVNYTKEVAKKLGITHLFIQKFSLSNEALSEKYQVDSVKFFEEHPETFKKVYENGLPLDQCLNQGGCDGNIIYEIEY